MRMLRRWWDGNPVTSRKPEDEPAFCRASLRVLAKKRAPRCSGALNNFTRSKPGVNESECKEEVSRFPCYAGPGCGRQQLLIRCGCPESIGWATPANPKATSVGLNEAAE